MTVIGFGGDETHVFGAGDVVVEFAGGGTDTVESAITVTLVAEVQRLVLTGMQASNGTGNAVANTITGNSVANVIDGGAGTDTLAGGLGNDISLVNAADVLVEGTDGGLGDRVRAWASFVLATGVQVEFLETSLATATTAINLTGKALAQTIIGNAGVNVLNGGLGMGRLTGGAGADAFVFNTAHGATNVDRITDFNHVADTIRLENAIFTGLGLATGALATTAFAANLTGTATRTSDRIIYETDTGILRYDSNGSTVGGTTAQFAVLTLPVTLDFTDFVVI